MALRQTKRVLSTLWLPGVWRPSKEKGNTTVTSSKQATLSKQSYIGTRDLDPETMASLQWLFVKQRELCQRYGYQEYGAPLIEPLELYASKSSEEIVKEQLYSFTDRGGRQVAIRPEMTPSLARLASRYVREHPLPLRWFSIANFMRYERPGKGRLREFFQMNVDLIGDASIMGHAEMLFMIIDLFCSLGIETNSFFICYSDRRLLGAFLDTSDPVRSQKLVRLLDKQDKLLKADFEAQLDALCSRKERSQLEAFLKLKIEDLAQLRIELEQTIRHQTPSPRIQAALLATEELLALDALLQNTMGAASQSLRFDPRMSRGFDYYTSFIFEAYPKDKKSRALLGGGRYDNLLGLFERQSYPAVGFALGDVTLLDFLRQLDRLPTLHRIRSMQPACFLIILADSSQNYVTRLASRLRSIGIQVEQSLDSKKRLAKQLQTAQKKGYRFAVIAGEDEEAQGQIILKDLEKATQTQIKLTEIESKVPFILDLRRNSESKHSDS